MLKKALILAALSLAGLCTWASTETEEIVRTFDLDPGGSISVDNINGSVVVHGWNEAGVRLQATKKAKADSKQTAREKLERLEVIIEAAADNISAVTKRTTRERKWNENVSVNYELWVPMDVVLEVETTNGKIQIEQVEGRISARTTNGKIDIDEASGSVNATTTNGPISADLRQYDGTDMKLQTTNGSISLVAPADLKADLEARTTNGSIKTDFPISVVGKLSRNRLKGAINGGGSLLKMKTTNGSIRLSEL